MSATLQPRPVTPEPIDRDTVDRRNRIDRRLGELKLNRTPFEWDWREIAELICPHRGRFLVPLSARRPRRSGHRIVDPTGTKAHQRLASFLMAGITNPTLNWVRLGVGDDSLRDDPDVKLYLAEVTTRIMRVLAEGNFYTSLHQVYEEIGGFGTGPMLGLVDYQDVVRWYPFTTGEYYLALNEREEVDTLYREFSRTVQQLVDEFGYDNCSTAVQSQWDNKQLSGLIKVVHAIEPNRDQRPGLGWRSKPWVSLYAETGITDRFLREEGFSYRPFIAPRWQALPGDPYGTGPGWTALPDVKSLQVTRSNLLEAAEKLVKPPMQADATLQQTYLGLLPGDINYVAGLGQMKEAGIKPVYQVPPNVQVMAEQAKEFQDTIKETFFNDLILAISEMEGVQPRNEVEINERRSEKMLMLGPVLERFYGEALAPAVRIVFDVMQAGKLLPPPPQALHGRQVLPTFINVLAQAQKAVGTSSIEQYMRFAGSLAGVYPESVDKTDVDEVLDLYAGDLNVDPRMVRSAQAVAAIRQSKAQQAQQQQLLQATPALAQGAAALGKTDVGGGRSALGAMLGTG